MNFITNNKMVKNYRVGTKSIILTKNKQWLGFTLSKV